MRVMMSVPVREYASAAEMLSSIAAIRRGFRTDDRTTGFPMRMVAELAEIEPPRAEPVLGPLPPVEWHQHTPVTVMDVLRAVSMAWGIDRNHILGTRRT